MDNVLIWATPILTTTPKRWMNLIDTLPADLLAQPPAPAEWSALQCLIHILDTERNVFAVRLKNFLAGKDLSAFDPLADGAQKSAASLSPVEIMREFTSLRAENLTVVERLTPDDLKRKAVHAELGPVTLDQMMHQWAAHDLNHTVQGERAIMQPFIRGCGPWDRYFTDHMIKAGKADA